MGRLALAGVALAAAAVVAACSPDDPPGGSVRLLAAAGGLLTLYLEPLWAGIGLALLAAAVALQLATRAARPAPT